MMQVSEGLTATNCLQIFPLVSSYDRTHTWTVCYTFISVEVQNGHTRSGALHTHVPAWLCSV